MKVKRNLLLCSWLSFFLLISVLPGNASVFAQQEKLALSSTQLTVREIFDAISSQLRYDVFYNGEQLDLNRKVKFAQQVLNLEQVLDAVANNRFKYTLEDRTIILTPLTTPQTVNSVTLTGQVTRPEQHSSSGSDSPGKRHQTRNINRSRRKLQIVSAPTRKHHSDLLFYRYGKSGSPGRRS